MNIEAKLQEVWQEYLNRIHHGHGSLLQAVEQHIAASQGKMLRPRLLLLCAATLGKEVFSSRRTLLLAVAIEMLHNASLLHDDVVDNADSRRGRPTVNHRWSNSVAVLLGDYLLSHTMQLLHEANDTEAMQRVNRTVAAMVEAELLALESWASNNSPTAISSEDTYLRIIDGKTASLFATACALGNPAYEAFGLHYGRLFQLHDDVADHEASPHTATLIQREEAVFATLSAPPNVPMWA